MCFESPGFAGAETDGLGETTFSWTRDKTKMTKWVYGFGGGVADGDAAMKNLLGGKGANLAEMSTLGLPVPPGFTLTTEVCTHYTDNAGQFPEILRQDVKTALATLEQQAGKRFGDASNPLLVSVRSGGRASMPGMMDTVLNLGLNPQTVEGLAALSGDRRFAFDSYRRFIQMYSDVVLGVDHELFEEILDEYKDVAGTELDTELTASDWESIAKRYLELVQEELGQPFPSDPVQQLWGAIGAVFDSWMNERAKVYRSLHDIPQSWGTAVNVQAMVFGNMGADSATGVAFTRNPSTGENAYYGEFLINAQGEDVVAGIRTPQTLTRKARTEIGDTQASMEEVFPEIFAQLTGLFDRLETHYRDMQDVEFTVEQSRLWILQTRSGKRTAKAALKIAVEMVDEGLITETDAVLRIEPASLDQLLHPTLAPGHSCPIIVTGLPASPGAATGEVVFDADEAVTRAANGRDVILVRIETSPEDIHGMHAAKGIVTARGGMTSHAAVVARGMGRPCVSGAGELQINYQQKLFTVAGRVVNEGETITVDGATGQVLAGAPPMELPELTGDFAILMRWADAARRMKVRTNAETPQDLQTALDFGAEGIGLCRTEHMFFEESRIAAVREMILASNTKGRVAALERILPMQQGDFAEIFRIIGDLPVTIRLLDPPLHEFLPHTEQDVAAVAKTTGLSVDALMARATMLAESNPMLGHRGCRLGISYPEIYEMQARAIFQAQALIKAETGKMAQVEIMIPLAATARELEILKDKVEAVANDITNQQGFAPQYLFGAMIELPRAALCAGELAEFACFFSFGTNDLTQTTLGLSRDDATSFLGRYISKGVFDKDPFVSIDESGVGQLVTLAAERARAARKDVKLGICGEHGGDPASVHFCEKQGLDYVSCSPFRVPIARLAAAQAAMAKVNSES
ncbi:Pyruvate,phosphate dikinase [hydrothermal vent metagenome]|uniref:pyruvate, phosphate dikinase n=1 Tax=hydrothermal vent metagenome TaxID=652676 RepID=A0A3B0RQV4_9ZZZZ